MLPAPGARSSLPKHCMRAGGSGMLPLHVCVSEDRHASRLEAPRKAICLLPPCRRGYCTLCPAPQRAPEPPPGRKDNSPGERQGMKSNFKKSPDESQRQPPNPSRHALPIKFQHHSKQALNVAWASLACSCSSAWLQIQNKAGIIFLETLLPASLATLAPVLAHLMLLCSLQSPTG